MSGAMIVEWLKEWRGVSSDYGVIRLPVEIVQGDGGVGKILVSHEGVHSVSMTGSSVTGRKIMEECGKSLKRVILELGGKDPMVVLSNADLNLAARDAVRCSVVNCGQVCCSVERIYVDETILENFERLVVEEAKKVKVGPAMVAEERDAEEEGDNNSNDHTTTLAIGPMATHLQAERVRRQVQEAIDQGGRVLYVSDINNGKVTVQGRNGEDSDNNGGGGSYAPVTVLTDLTQDMDIARHETFGPVVSIHPFNGSEDTAVKLANDSKLGLTASVYDSTTNPDRAWRVASRIRAGQVSINSMAMEVAPLSCPWVGHKDSGMGYHSGQDGYRQFSVPKSIVMKK